MSLLKEIEDKDFEDAKSMVLDSYKNMFTPGPSLYQKQLRKEIKKANTKAELVVLDNKLTVEAKKELLKLF